MREESAHSRYREDTLYQSFHAWLLFVVLAALITIFGVSIWFFSVLFCPLLIFFGKVRVTGKLDAVSWFKTRDVLVLLGLMIPVVGYFFTLIFKDGSLHQSITGHFEVAINLPVSRFESYIPENRDLGLSKLCKLKCDDVQGAFERTATSMYFGLIFSGAAISFIPILPPHLSLKFSTRLDLSVFWMAVSCLLLMAVIYAGFWLTSEIGWEFFFQSELKSNKGVFLPSLSIWGVVWIGVLIWYGVIEAIFLNYKGISHE